MSSSGESLGRVAFRRFRRSKTGIVGLVLVLFFIFVGAFAPILANDQPILCRYKGEIHAPGLVECVQRNIPGSSWIISKSKPFDQVSFRFKESMRTDAHPGDWFFLPIVPYSPDELCGSITMPPSHWHRLGTDASGRDVLARMIWGARISMLVGFVSVGLSTIIGIMLGGLAGYFRGPVDIVISRLLEIVLCFPVIFLVLLLLATVSEPSIWYVMLVIGLVSWTGVARYIRGEFIRLRDSEFVLAAKSLGSSPTRIMVKHLLPNSLAPIFVTVSFGIAAAIIVEASLSWLGFGVQEPTASWGSVLRAGYDQLQTSPHVIFPPCVAIFLAVLSYNLVGDALRDAIDPRVAKG